jgi:hypothetical protein
VEQEPGESLHDDGGWPIDRWHLLLLIPGAGFWILRHRAKTRATDALDTLRWLFIAFVSGLLSFGFVLLFIQDDLPNGSVIPWLPVLLGYAAVVIALAASIERPLDCSSDAQLFVSYRNRLFVRTAIGESVALWAFVFAFVGGPGWIYYPGLAVALAYFWARVAPTRSALCREQDELNAQGCGRSLVRALRIGSGGPRRDTR